MTQKNIAMCEGVNYTDSRKIPIIHFRYWKCLTQIKKWQCLLCLKKYKEIIPAGQKKVYESGFKENSIEI